MNAAEYLQHLHLREQSAPLGSLRRSLYRLEGMEETDRLIARGLSAWAVERSGRGRPQSRVVFGSCRSDALRRAAAPARLGAEITGEVTDARRITSKWDEPIAWPFTASGQENERG